MSVKAPSKSLESSSAANSLSLRTPTRRPTRRSRELGKGMVWWGRGYCPSKHPSKSSESSSTTNSPSENDFDVWTYSDRSQVDLSTVVGQI